MSQTEPIRFGPGRCRPSAQTCPKCGADTVTPRFHANVRDCLAMRDSDGKRVRDSRGGEHLHYLCDRCGYDITTPCGVTGDAPDLSTRQRPGTHIQS